MHWTTVGSCGWGGSYERGTPVGTGAGEEDAGEEGVHDRPRLPPLLDRLICAIFPRQSYMTVVYETVLHVTVLFVTVLYATVLHMTFLCVSQAQEQEKKMLEKKGFMIDRAFHLYAVIRRASAEVRT